MPACRSTLLVLAVALLATACDAPPTGPLAPEAASRRGQAPSPPVLGFPVDRPVLLPLEPSSTYLCTLVVYPGGGLASRHLTFPIVGARAARLTGNEAVGRWTHARWERLSKRKILEAACVVPLTTDAVESLRAGFNLDLDEVLRTRVGDGEATLRTGSLPEAASWSGLIYCDGVQGTMHCTGGVVCHGDGEMLRAGVGDQANTWFGCSNGCTLDLGSGYYYCPGGGGDWVEGEDPGGGGEGGGGGGGSGGGGEPEAPPASYDDNDPSLGIQPPNCRPLPPLGTPQRAWCDGRVPTGLDSARVVTALNRIRNKTGICAVIANEAEALIAAGGFRIWTRTTEPFSGAAPRNGDWVVLADYWINNFHGTELDAEGLNLDGAIVHEIDHHMGFFGSTVGQTYHLLENGVENPYHTMHSRQCSPEPPI